MSFGSNAADYLQQLINLTPPGSAFPTEDSSNWVSLLSAISQTCARIDANAVLLFNESLPDTTQQLLPNWERVAGLPDSCSDSTDTFAVRRLNLIAKLTSRGGQSIAYFISLALTLGYTVTINEFRPFQVSISAVGDPLCDASWWFAWQVNAPLNSIVYFRAGQSSAGDALATWGNTRLECVIKKYKPAQSAVLFAYS